MAYQISQPANGQWLNNTPLFIDNLKSLFLQILYHNLMLLKILYGPKSWIISSNSSVSANVKIVKQTHLQSIKAHIT